MLNLLSAFGGTADMAGLAAGSTRKPLQISDAIDGWLQKAWDHTNTPYGHPNLFVYEAKSNLGWYYNVCTDHAGDDWFENKDFKDFLYVAASLTSVNMAMDDPANKSIYKARAAQYERWRDALYAAEAQKGLARRMWESLTGAH